MSHQCVERGCWSSFNIAADLEGIYASTIGPPEIESSTPQNAAGRARLYARTHASAYPHHGRPIRRFDVESLNVREARP